MINWFLRRKTSGIDHRPLELGEIQRANKVLFSLFTRYGDTIIDLVVIQEFIAQYPDKEYLVLCPRQMKPYVNELLPEVRCATLNKRNLVDMLKVDRLLKKWRPDIGFNPWSNGLDSCYFLTYCQRYHCYKDFVRSKAINHYEVVRRYLSLPEKTWVVHKLDPKKTYQKVLICPQSTDVDRSISAKHMEQIIANVKENYGSLNITVAAMDLNYFRPDCRQFIFQKTEQSSQAFINLVKRSDLVVCADSAPLHMALALRKHTQAVFYITSPEIVLNSESNILYA